jgi:hypothetical protein
MRHTAAQEEVGYRSVLVLGVNDLKPEARNAYPFCRLWLAAMPNRPSETRRHYLLSS